MMENIKALLQNAQLQQHMKDATDLEEVAKLIATAGVQKGYPFTPESVAQAVSGLMVWDSELTEAELQEVAGGITFRSMRICA